MMTKLILLLLAAAIAADELDCGGNGRPFDGKCMCKVAYGGEHCELLVLKHRCQIPTEAEHGVYQCPSNDYYCLHDDWRCAFDIECENPGGWCMPWIDRLPHLPPDSEISPEEEAAILFNQGIHLHGVDEETVLGPNSPYR